MSDQGRWFKLWCSSLTDSSLDSLDIADFGRWAKFGAHMKEHGNEGVIVLQKPERVLCTMLQVDDFAALIAVLSKFPNVTVSCETNAIVTFRNWHKYQGDNSTARVKRFRERVTAKKRREEKREEEKRSTTTRPAEPSAFGEFWLAYPKKKNKGDAEKAWGALHPAAELVSRILSAVAAQRRSVDWTKDAGKWIPYPASWLRGKRWEDTFDEVRTRPTLAEILGES